MPRLQCSYLVVSARNCELTTDNHNVVHLRADVSLTFTGVNKDIVWSDHHAHLIKELEVKWTLMSSQ